MSPLSERRNAPCGGGCSEMIELEDSEQTIISPPHLSRHPNGIHVKEWFLFKECSNRVRKYDTTLR
jgi:hypothetical protein